MVKILNLSGLSCHEHGILGAMRRSEKIAERRLVLKTLVLARADADRISQSRCTLALLLLISP